MKFDTWFIQQFGTRPSSAPLHELQRAVFDIEQQLAIHKSILEKCNRYDSQYQSASYAWKIQDRDKS